MSLKNACFSIWRPNYERKGISSKFKPLFVRYIGVENLNEYNNILKTLVEKVNEHKNYSIYFDGSIPLQAEFEVIKTIGDELKTMNVHDLKNQDIVLFSNSDLNEIFLESLDFVVNLALKQESFFNDNSRNDFILKLIVWTYSYIRPLKFEHGISPKCIYYGDISNHEIYFLMMLYLMTFDVIYINPLRDENWNIVDTLNASELHKNIQTDYIETLFEKTKDASIIDYEESITLQLEREIESELLANTGVYRPWQYRNGKVKPLFIRSTIIDLKNNYNEPARVRNGFKTENDIVTIPNYFFQIDGEYDNEYEYIQLVKQCTSSKNTLVLNNRGDSLLTNPISSDEILKMTFCMLSDNSFDIKELSQLSFYGWGRYKESVQLYLLNKINELFNDKNIFTKELSQNKIFEITSRILTMNQDIVKMVDNFDYTDEIPKLVIFLEKEDFVSDEIQYFLAYINKLGFDIIIFNPSGLLSIDRIINSNRFNYIRLDNMVYNRTFDSINKKISIKNTKNIFGKLFS